MMTKLRDLFEHFQGCTNHDCLMTGPKKGMGTNGNCSCLMGGSRSQMQLLNSRFKSMAEYFLVPEIPMYQLDKDQLKLLRRWRADHQCTIENTGAIGGGETVSFTPTSLGMITKASCACGESIDLTDYESW